MYGNPFPEPSPYMQSPAAFMQQPNYMAPTPYGQPPPPPIYSNQGPVLIKIDGNNDQNGMICPCCQVMTPSLPRKTVGAASILWCLAMTILCGIIGFAFLCMEDLQDTEMICTRCQSVKMIVPANFC